MAVRIKVGGRPIANPGSYSVQEDSTPINPADETGGTSQINFSAPAWPGWKLVEDEPIDLSDLTQGFTSGFGMSASNSNGVVQVTGASRLQALTSRRRAQPFQGTLTSALRYYFGLVGLVDGIIIEPELANIPVVFPGWEDSVYQKIARGICPAFGVELSLVSNNIVVRYPRLRKAIPTRLSSNGISQTLDSGNRAQRAKLNWAKTRWVTNSLVYPTGGWNPDVEVLDVNAGQVKVYESLEVSASLVSVEQPTCVLNIGPAYDSSSVYTVAGNDGLPVPPKMWTDYGGSLSVEVNPDTRSLKVTIRGMDFPEYGPYQIAVSSGDGTSYSTLRIRGTGVILDPQVVDQGTGLDADQAPDEYSDEVTNEFITNVDQAYQAAAWQVAGATGPARGISFSASGINRAADSGSTAFATLQDWDDTFAGMTTDDWDAIWAGKSADDWEAFWDDKVDGAFKNQAFGNVAGARVVHEDSIFRIRTAQNSGGLIQVTADLDCTVGDFDTFYAGMTMADFDAFWGADAVTKEFDVGPFPGIAFDGTRPAK